MKKKIPNKKTQIARIDKAVIRDLDNALGVRFKNNLISRKEFNVAGGFRLLRRTIGWKISLKELMTKPKKEDVRR